MDIIVFALIGLLVGALIGVILKRMGFRRRGKD